MIIIDYTYTFITKTAEVEMRGSTFTGVLPRLVCRGCTGERTLNLDFRGLNFRPVNLKVQ